MGQLVIELKQHTPLLHFQHAQYGATLRATEVKPKLDKFILQREKKEALASCFIEGSTKALNYKMKIQIKQPGTKKNSNQTTEVKPYIIPQSPYFAKVSKGLFYPDSFNLSIIFFSLNQSVLNYINKYIQEFFICTNFGTRSNKGFGSFTVCKKNGVAVNSGNVIEILTRTFDFVYQKEVEKDGQKENPSIAKLFSIITNDYRLIKSGSTIGGYKKSGFYYYTGKKLKKYTWDKPYLKNKLSVNLEKGKCLWVKNIEYANKKTDITHCKFVRPFLGLTDNYLFQLADISDRTIRTGEAKVKVKCEDSHIERFASPLLFKIIDKKIYIVGKSGDTQPIAGKSFSLTYKKRKIGELDTPDDFDLDDFMHYVLMDKYKNELNYTELKNKYGNTAKR